jgi:hypothetical protein
VKLANQGGAFPISSPESFDVEKPPFFSYKYRMERLFDSLRLHHTSLGNIGRSEVCRAVGLQRRQAAWITVKQETGNRDVVK